MPLHWRGDEVLAKTIAASELAIDKTMSQAVGHAKANHPWKNVTGTLEGSIQLVDPAHVEGVDVVGRWGSVAVIYAIFLELGTSKMPPYPFLRPAADVWYPLLRAYLAAALRGEQL